MQREDSEKTGLGRKLLFAGVALACVAGASAWWVLRNHASERKLESGVESPEDVPPFTYQLAHMMVGTRKFTLDVADTPGKMHLGLADRDAMPTDGGMVFVYQAPGERCFWMKDMRTSIDIVWLDDERRVVHVESTLSPDTYPTKYCPEQPAQYVIELAAGVAKEVGLKTGDTVDLTL